MKPLRGAQAGAEPAAGHDQAEPAKPLGGAVDWASGVEPSKPVAGGIDWSRGVDPYADVAVISGEVADRPNWLHSGERYDERFLAPAADGEAPAQPANPVLMPWNYVPGPQKSRIIPIVGGGVVALLAVFWVATSAGVTVTPPDLPFLSRDETANASTPTPKPSPKVPAEVGRYPHAGERYAAVVGVDSARLNASLADVTSSCAPEQPVEPCRPAAQNALAAVQAFRLDLAALTVPACAKAANAELQRGLQLYAAGLNQMANAESGHPDQLAAGEATFDLGSQHLIAYDRLLRGADVSACN